MFTPVKNYQCAINTGTAKPIPVKKINYGPKQTVNMCKSIAALAKVGQIHQTQDGAWLLKHYLPPSRIRSTSATLKV
jgi:hypothetical protein